ncbi:MAG: hypothetical protein RSE18_00515 [Acinetobacter sp.]
MNAVDFVKECGIDVAKRTLGNAVGFGCSEVDLFGGKYIFRTDDLKQIIDAFELIEAWGGLEDAKLYNLSHCESKPDSMGYKLIQAISLVEQCQ